jgi:rare lipoprotein A
MAFMAGSLPMANALTPTPSLSQVAPCHLATRLIVTNQDNGRSVVVRGNDRGPFVPGRIIDLSEGAFSQIASPSQGLARVCYRLA